MKLYNPLSHGVGITIMVQRFPHVTIFVAISYTPYMVSVYFPTVIMVSSDEDPWTDPLQHRNGPIRLACGHEACARR